MTEDAGVDGGGGMRPKSTEQAAKSRRIVVDVGRSGGVAVGAQLVRRVRREHFKYVGVGAGLILC